MKVKSGYTLIEILVAISIIGVLFSFGFVSYRDFSRRQALSGLVKQIQGDLRLAQGDAAAGYKPSGCLGTLDSYSFYISSNSVYKVQANCGATTTDVKSVTLPSGATMSTNSIPSLLKFKVLGQGTNLSGGVDWIMNLQQAGTGVSASIMVTSGGEIK